MRDQAAADWRERRVSAAEAVSVVRPGDKVFVGSACATPRTLVDALEQSRQAGVVLVHFLTDRVVTGDTPRTKYRHRVFYVGRDIRALHDMPAVREAGLVDYVPISLGDVPQLFNNGQIPLDVAMVQVAPPDPDGTCSLGISVDVTKAAALAARTVIAEVNPAMPRTAGDSRISVDRIAYFAEVDTPVVEYLHEPAGEVAEQIARYVARLIDDRSTLQVGLGRVPNEMLAHLTNRRDLAIHSNVITEPIVDLVAAGVVTGPVATSMAMGSRRLYDLVDGDPRFTFHPIEYICDPAVIASRDRMVSVTQAFTIDLTGQVSTEGLDGSLYGGVSTGPAFHRGALASAGGMAIVCLAARTPAGRSAISLDLDPDGAVTIPRADVHWVITEYGTAYLFGRSVAERAVALIEIAHPEVRSELLDSAIERGLVPPGQQLRSRTRVPRRSGARRAATRRAAGVSAPHPHERHPRDAGPLLPAQRGGSGDAFPAQAELTHRYGRAAPLQRRLRGGDGLRRRGRAVGAGTHRGRQLLLPQSRQRDGRGGVHGGSGVAGRGPRSDFACATRRVRTRARRARPDRGRAARQLANDACVQERRLLRSASRLRGACKRCRCVSDGRRQRVSGLVHVTHVFLTAKPARS